MENEYKMILLGDSRSGKTSILQMYHDSTFNETQHRTIGMDLRISQKNLTGNQTQKVLIFDAEGVGNFMMIVKNLMKRIHQAIIVYDVTNPDGLASVQRWLNFLRESQSQNLSIIIVANKIDKINERVITINQEIEFAQQLGLQYYQTSAQDKQSVDFMFENALQTLIIHRYNMKQKLEEEEITQNKLLWQVMRKYQESLKIYMVFLFVQLLFIIFTFMLTNIIQIINSFDLEKNYIISTVGGIILTLFSFIFLIYTGLTLKR